MNESISDTYEALGMQGVFERFGSSGVRRILTDWRCRQRAMAIDASTELTVGGDFCYAFAGGDLYRQTGMGVKFRISGPFRSGGVFTMARENVPYFRKALDRVAYQERFREGNGQTLLIPISSRGMGDGAEQVLVSRSGAQAALDVIWIRFGSASVTVDRGDVPKLKMLVDQAVEDVERYVEAEERGKRVIARNQPTSASNSRRP